ncbi:sensor histidine kinase [Maribacter sp. Asnod1-A12]|uniref:sensor histidine kinase n=1 Tax=Maribacter sp. Asnod1-A12 TaxID=3160576 RepID=UPI003866F37C
MFLTVYGYPQTDDHFIQFLSHIDQYNFEEAENSIPKLKGPIKDLSINLMSLLHNEGQIPFSLKQVCDIDKTSSLETKFLNHLVIGYYNLFHDLNKKRAFKNFYDAYYLSHELNHPSITKVSLLALLKYYSYEIAQNDKAHLKYLEEYDMLCDSNVNCFWAEIYDTIFMSKGFGGSLEKYFKKEDILKIEIDKMQADSPLRVLLYFELATLFDIKGDKASAMRYYTLTVDGAKNKPYLKKQKFFASLKLALIFSEKNTLLESNKFRTIAEQSINLADTLRAKYYLHLFDAQIKNSTGDFQGAYANLMSAYRLEFELDFRRNSLEVNRLQVELNTAEKEKQILEEKQKAQITRNWLIAATIALIFGAGIAILVQKNTTKKRKLAEQETLLKQERVDNLLKEQELVSIDAMIEGQEKERQHVANELHDDLGSLMATIKLHFGNVKGKDKDPALKQAQSLLEEAYQKVRGIAHSKNSGVMSSQGLLPAVKKMAQVISETNALEVSVEDFGMGERMENSLELSLFRTIQEIVANAIKHAEATKLSIQISQYEDNLNIIIEDNGKGFDRSKIDKSKTGMGLTNIEKRIEHLEGNFTIDSVLGKGTSILIDIPV